MLEREKGNFFVSFEGPDGSGKSTQVKLIADWFNDNSQETKVFREPGLILLEHSLLLNN